LLRQNDLPMREISEIVLYLKSGFAAGSNDQDNLSRRVIQIRPTNIDEHGNLYFDRNIYLKEEFLEKKESELLKKGEVLFNNTNSQELVGKSAYFDLEGDYFSSNHITRIKSDTSLINPFFLTLILNLYQKSQVFYNICTNWNNQSGVNIDLLKSIPIPTPPLETQSDIVEEVEHRMAQAKQLQQEAQDVLAEAKRQVENLIIPS